MEEGVDHEPVVHYVRVGVHCANAREFDHDISVHAPGVDVGLIVEETGTQEAVGMQPKRRPSQVKEAMGIGFEEQNPWNTVMAREKGIQT